MTAQWAAHKMNDLATAIDNMVLVQMYDYVRCWGDCVATNSWDYLFDVDRPERSDDEERARLPQASALLKICMLLLYILDWLRGAAYTIGAISLAIFSFAPSLTGRFNLASFGWLMGSMFIVSMVPEILAFVMNGDIALSCTRINEEYPLQRLYPTRRWDLLEGGTP